MTEKIIFILQISALGLFVVMVVLCLLYVLILLINTLWNRLSAKRAHRKPLPPVETDTGDTLSPQLLAAITAAVNCYRSLSEPEQRPFRIKEVQVEGQNSHWAAAGRRALLENSILWENIRGK